MWPSLWRRPVALIVDDDLAFVCWLGELLSEAGYQAAPASDSRQAAALIKELNLDVDLVVVNPDLPSVSQMIETLSRPDLKIVAIRNPDTDVLGTIQAQATPERRAGRGPISRPEWLRRVRSVWGKARGARAGGAV